MKKLTLILFCFLLVNCSNSGSDSTAPVTDISDQTPAATPEEPVPTPNPIPTPNPTPEVPVATAEALPKLTGPVQLIVTPNAKGHVEFLSAINKTLNGDTLRMAMFHLTDRNITSALISAHNRGVIVKVILDSASFILPNFKIAYNQLKDANVDVRASSSAFTISHQKSMTINNTEAFITAINLTGLPETTRDFGLIVHDTNIVNEVNAVFDQDWINAETGQGITPSLSESHLVWSPVNSLKKIVGMISSAKKSISVQVENLGSAEIQAAFIAAVKRGVNVRVVTPMCSKGGSAKLNYPYLAELKSGGVQTKIMPEPETVTQPYMHSKMMIIDGVNAYVGSVNFSKNSTTKARELGILFSEVEPMKQLVSLFEKDWNVSIAVPNESSVSCSLF